MVLAKTFSPSGKGDLTNKGQWKEEEAKSSYGWGLAGERGKLVIGLALKDGPRAGVTEAEPQPSSWNEFNTIGVVQHGGPSWSLQMINLLSHQFPPFCPSPFALFSPFFFLSSPYPFSLCVSCYVFSYCSFLACLLTGDSQGNVAVLGFFSGSWAGFQQD